MREIQTGTRQPRDEQGEVHHSQSRIEKVAPEEPPPPKDGDAADGRDRPPEGAPRRNSPWLGGG